MNMLTVWMLIMSYTAPAGLLKPGVRALKHWVQYSARAYWDDHRYIVYISASPTELEGKNDAHQRIDHGVCIYLTSYATSVTIC